jgi:hypothetical protein
MVYTLLLSYIKEFIAVGTALGYRLNDQGLISGRGCEFFSLPLCPDQLWNPHNLLSNGYQVFLAGGKAAMA